jgi:hypothetical protein
MTVGGVWLGTYSLKASSQSLTVRDDGHLVGSVTVTARSRIDCSFCSGDKQGIWDFDHWWDGDKNLTKSMYVDIPPGGYTGSECHLVEKVYYHKTVESATVFFSYSPCRLPAGTKKTICDLTEVKLPDCTYFQRACMGQSGSPQPPCTWWMAYKTGHYVYKFTEMPDIHLYFVSWNVYGNAANISKSGTQVAFDATGGDVHVALTWREDAKVTVTALIVAEGQKWTDSAVKPPVPVTVNGVTKTTPNEWWIPGYQGITLEAPASITYNGKTYRFSRWENVGGQVDTKITLAWGYIWAYPIYVE